MHALFGLSHLMNNFWPLKQPTFSFELYSKLRDLKRFLYNRDCRNILNFAEDENGFYFLKKTYILQPHNLLFTSNFILCSLSICFIYWAKGADRIDMAASESSVHTFRMMLKDLTFCLRISLFIFVKTT